MVTSSDGGSTIFLVDSYQWNTGGCFTNNAHYTPTCFPTGQTTQSVTGNSLLAEDAGTITCTVTIGGVDYSSGPLTLRISGIHVVNLSIYSFMLCNKIQLTYMCNFIVLVHHCIIVVLLLYILGIAVFRPFMFITSNQIADYSFVTQSFTLNQNDNMTIVRCATGLGPSGSDSSTDLGGWYFNGAQIPVGTNCGGPVFEVRATNNEIFPGGINLLMCRTFTTTEEGVYSCIMMNSSMVEQTMRVGFYFSGRSKSLDMYPITSLLTIFYLSAQLFQ